MTGHEIRTRFLEHFRNRDHHVLPSASLIPVGDPTTLFISAGMQPLQPYYLGVSRPPAPRLASCQKCFRTLDIEEVGKTDRHDTFFEMLGNFAPTGDYFKETAIPLAWEFVTGPLEIPADKIRITIHPSDDEAFGIWTRDVGVRAEWVYRAAENWWGLDLGPCGPDSEIWFDRGPGVGCGQPDCRPDHCTRFLEFWNLVFPQFDKQPDGSLPPLPNPAIDTGMGVERIAAIKQGVESIFETDLFAPIVDFVRENSANRSTAAERTVTDHLRAMTFVIGDGVLPAKEGRGYVLRRLMRRALLHAGRLGMTRPLADGVSTVVGLFGGQYPELVERMPLIEEVINGEAARFGRTLEQGLELFERLVARHPESLPGAEVFKLHDTFGFPLELTRELAAERSLGVDLEGFEVAMAAQRTRSRTLVKARWANLKSLPRGDFVGYHRLDLGADVAGLRREGGAVDEAVEGEEVEVFLDATPFYAESGGQIGDSGRIDGPDGWVRVDDTQRPVDGVIAHLGVVANGRIRTRDSVHAEVEGGRRHQIARHHTATHLLHRSLREVLGDKVAQRGSWVGPDHATFDFPLDRAMTSDEVQRVNALVMDQVRAALPFAERNQSYDQAVAEGATHLFDEKYGDVVRVVCFGEWTCELCGGTHVDSSADVGTAIIVSESSVGSGLRRIDLVAGEAADALVRRRLATLNELARSLGVPPDGVAGRVAYLRTQLREREREIQTLKEFGMRARAAGGADGIFVDAEAEPNHDPKAFADLLLDALGHPGVALVTKGPRYVLKVSRQLTDRFDATKLKSELGPGGGRPEMVQGKLDVPRDQAVERLRAIIG